MISLVALLAGDIRSNRSVAATLRFPEFAVKINGAMPQEMHQRLKIARLADPRDERRP